MRFFSPSLLMDLIMQPSLLMDLFKKPSLLMDLFLQPSLLMDLFMQPSLLMDMFMQLSLLPSLHNFPSHSLIFQQRMFILPQLDSTVMQTPQDPTLSYGYSCQAVVGSIMGGLYITVGVASLLHIVILPIDMVIAHTSLTASILHILVFDQRRVQKTRCSS